MATPSPALAPTPPSLPPPPAAAAAVKLFTHACSRQAIFRHGLSRAPNRFPLHYLTTTPLPHPPRSAFPSTPCPPLPHRSLCLVSAAQHASQAVSIIFQPAQIRCMPCLPLLLLFLLLLGSSPFHLLTHMSGTGLRKLFVSLCFVSFHSVYFPQHSKLPSLTHMHVSVCLSVCLCVWLCLCVCVRVCMYGLRLCYVWPRFHVISQVYTTYFKCLMCLSHPTRINFLTRCQPPAPSLFLPLATPPPPPTLLPLLLFFASFLYFASYVVATQLKRKLNRKRKRKAFIYKYCAYAA